MLKLIFKITTWLATVAAVVALIGSYLAWDALKAFEQDVATFRQSCGCTVSHPTLGMPLAGSHWMCEREAPECERAVVLQKFRQFDFGWPKLQDNVVNWVERFSIAFSLALSLWMLQLFLFLWERAKADRESAPEAEK